MEELTNVEFGSIDSAFWNWVKRNCPYGVGERAKRVAWIASERFPFAGRTWLRSATRIQERNGKAILGWAVTYESDDGALIEDKPAPPT